MQSKLKRKEERRQRRDEYLHEMYRGHRVHIAAWCVFLVWFLLLAVILLLFIYVKVGNYTMW